MFKFLLFNVGHGSCAFATLPSGTTMLFDCGYDNELQFYPSRFFSDREITNISELVISHFDQDHIANLPDIRKVLTIGSIRRNKSIPATTIRQEKQKSGELTSAMALAIDMHETWIHPVAVPINYGGVNVQVFSNDYPAFTDMNNLSLVTFLEYGGCGIVIPGDLDKKGWTELLQKEAFRQCLQRTTIFIASHHGRVDGYCEAVFDYCKPHVILLSDKEIVHDTQEQDYQQHASGIGPEGSKRRVYTTRSDGHILITKELGKNALVSTIWDLNKV
jgi:beta-lactamase superfamily II metal-dependent hydrolase